MQLPALSPTTPAFPVGTTQVTVVPTSVRGLSLRGALTADHLPSAAESEAP
jgi:hypothetical protein